jgi:hypothetical protein
MPALLRRCALLFAAVLLLAACPQVGTEVEEPAEEPVEEPTPDPAPTPDAPDDEPADEPVNEPIAEAHTDDRDSGDMPRDNEPTDLVDVRAAEQAGFDRVVLEFEGPERPGWQVSGREEAAHPETGEDIGVDGEHFLFVEFHFAGYDAPEHVTLAGQVVTEVVFAHDDAHGLVGVFIGLAHAAPYATAFLTDPLRFVIDVVDEEAEAAADRPEDVEVTAEEIRGAHGEVLATIEEFPDNVQPDEDTEFGGPTHFTDAVLSDDGSWLAIGSAGVAHSYGWLYELGADDPQLVAFQYGGSLQAHSFSPDDRFALFTIGTPAETGLLKVVDREDIAEHASDTGFVVEVDEEGDPPFAYEFDDWREPHILCFTFEGTSDCVDASTEELESAS